MTDKATEHFYQKSDIIKTFIVMKNFFVALSYLLCHKQVSRFDLTLRALDMRIEHVPMSLEQCLFSQRQKPSLRTRMLK